VIRPCYLNLSLFSRHFKGFWLRQGALSQVLGGKMAIRTSFNHCRFCRSPPTCPWPIRPNRHSGHVGNLADGKQLEKDIQVAGKDEKFGLSARSNS